MEKHLLVTLGSSSQASSSLRFVHGFFGSACDLRLTLFYVAPRQAGAAADPVAGPEASMLAAINEAKKQQGPKVVEESKDWLVGHGCTLDQVDTKVVRSRGGTVREIIQEATVGLYDAVVMGRRGLTWLAELVDESVSHRLLWEELDFPVWVCRRPPVDPKPTVLLALDGSDASLRMADHVGFMLSSSERHKVTLFHVAEGKAASGSSEQLFANAKKALLENGVADGQVETKVVKSSDPAEAILKEASRADFGVVAVGRKAGAPSTRERLFPGSVSSQLLGSLDKATLWVSK